MPIRFKVVQGNTIIEEYANKPTVYLDNWTFNAFALGDELGKEFIKIINDKNGSLAFSIINLLEITVREDDEQINKIKNFIDSIDGFFIDVDPHNVIKKEKDYRNRGITQSPVAGVDLLKANFLHAHKPYEQFRISEIIPKLRDEIRSPSNENHELEQHFEKTLYPIILRARSDTKALERAHKRFKQKIKCEFPCTRQILSKCIDFIVLNRDMKMPNKEWCDVLNLIVPVSYCDFVLADSRWENFIRNLNFEKPCIAQVYNPNSTQIEQFLKDLSNYENIKS